MEFEFEDFASGRFHVQFTHAAISVRLEIFSYLFIYLFILFRSLSEMDGLETIEKGAFLYLNSLKYL